MSHEDHREMVASSNSRRSINPKLVRSVIKLGKHFRFHRVPVPAEVPDVGVGGIVTPELADPLIGAGKVIHGKERGGR
ncbi:hypothetical protein IM40_03560 [Candidatus Paracaedimonas acanthamoebae]|nr:hypothetical protein IM40_03560 [Candidatus Paracaedimonas acanthamoebae]